MKCQILFSGKNKKNLINLSSAEFKSESRLQGYSENNFLVSL